MQKYDVIQLIAEEPSERGVFEQAQETRKTVFCEVRSVSRSEVYQARAIGANPTLVFVLTVADDYNDEKDLVYKGKRYRVVRTYVNGDGIEITAEEWHGEAEAGA